MEFSRIEIQGLKTIVNKQHQALSALINQTFSDLHFPETMENAGGLKSVLTGLETKITGLEARLETTVTSQTRDLKTQLSKA